MMYRIEDKEKAITAIQRYLLIISQVNRFLPHITVDGVYGKETKEAVTIFQTLNGLEASGEVDFATFELLSVEAEKILNSKNPKHSYCIGFSSHFGAIINKLPISWQIKISKALN